MQPVNEAAHKAKRPIKILQYGEGNFLRAFADYMVDIANEKGVLNSGIQIIKPIPYGSLEDLRAQGCVYTVLLRGKKDGAAFVEKRIVTSVAGAADASAEYGAYAAFARSPELRFIISNTTEAGIVYDPSDDMALSPPKTYPGKLTRFLYDRYQAFDGAPDKGLIILPVELIEKNGEKLKECCLKLAALWDLPQAFRAWLAGGSTFCNTLVDRIVTGYPKDEAEALERDFGYTDKMIVTGEPFALWVIESENPEDIEKEFPLNKAGLPVVFTTNLQPYRERKVRILNGAHTSSVLAAYLSGLDTAGEMMNDKTLRAFLEKAVYSELAPMVPLPADEVRQFAGSVMERFENPFIKHNLLSIALNSVSKFKTRILPTILETWEKTGALPDALCFSLAALAAFYSGSFDGAGRLMAMRSGQCYEILDDAPVLKFFSENHALPAEQLAQALLRREDFWGASLTQIPGLCGKTAEGLQSIRDLGMRAAIEKFLS